MKLIKERETIYSILLFLVIFTATLGFKLNSISVILLSVFYLIDKSLFSKLKKAKNIIVLLFSCYFLIYLVGYFYSNNKVIAIHEIEVRLSFLVLPIILITEKISSENIKKVFVFLKYWLIIIAAYLLLHKVFIVGGPISTLSTHSLIFVTNVHQAYYSLFYIFCLLFIIYQIKTNQINKTIGFLEILFFLFFIVLLNARVTVLFAIIITILFLLQESLKAKGNKKTIILLGVFFFYFISL